MTKMEEEDMTGGEIQAAVPTSNQTTTPLSREGGGGARFCGTAPPSVKTDPDTPMLCAGCDGQILDKYYMRVDGRSWHEKCVCCEACKKPLSESCYSKNCKLYCREDYKRLQYCHRCNSSINGKELVMRVNTISYHVRCFSCDYCSQQMNSGDHFHVLSDNIKQKLCCKTCYDIDDVNPKSADSDSEESQSDVFPPPTHHPMGLSMPPYIQDYDPHRHQGVLPCGSNGSGHRSVQDPKRSKRPRTILTTAQRRKFKASFEISQKPCRKVRETLASETGLTPRVVQVWFQNQRAKMKKIARRQSQGEGGTRRGKRKKDADSDSENEVPSSPGSYTSAPTPHQAQYYADYQSPGSIQTSPTSTQESSITGYFAHSHQLHGINHSEAPFDDYDVPSHLQMDDQYLRPVAAPVATSHPMEGTTHVEMQRMIHDRATIPYRMTQQEVMHDMMTRHPDDVIHRHDDGRHSSGYQSNPEHSDTFAHSRHLEPMDMSHEHPQEIGASSDVTNPIDSLMFMQNNFFRT